MAYQGPDYQVNPGETRTVPFDFTSSLVGGETVVSVNWGISAIGGVDIFAYSHLGTPTLSGNAVSNKVSGLLAPVKYIVGAEATTSAGNIYLLYTHVTCMNPS
jgi:hypothetical protein